MPDIHRGFLSEFRPSFGERLAGEMENAGHPICWRAVKKIEYFNMLKILIVNLIIIHFN